MSSNVTEIAVSAMMSCPALQGVSSHWPAAWDRVPRLIRMLHHVQPDHILALVDAKLRGMAALKGQEYLAWVNAHGAVSAIMPSGQRLGAYPSEFEVVEFHDGELVRREVA